MKPGTFVADVAERRRRARQHLEKGAVTDSYGGDIETAVKILNEALASEIVCVLRYKYHAAVASGINSSEVKAEFEEHAGDEQRHADWIAERINQLGGKPNMNPEGLLSRATTEYVEGNNLIDMIRENLVAERIAVDTYTDMIHYFGEKDPTSRRLMEKILEEEEEHANDMHDLLVANEGKPMLPRD